MAATARPQAQTQERASLNDRAAAAVSIADGPSLLKRAQRALLIAKRVATKYSTSDDEAAQEQARQILDLCEHVDAAVALVEGE